ncbi:Lipase_class 3 family protein [Hexamita inflata]|uniref:sn-1-specific diacylglycerol lipase n=1 Tax=Hexamita inflata TaxID=28002 RepID=A0ABP1HIK2_9EUKA
MQPIAQTIFKCLKKYKVTFFDLLRYSSKINYHDIKFIRESSIDTQMLRKYVIIACYLTTWRLLHFTDISMSWKNICLAMCTDLNDFRRHLLSSDLKQSLLEYFKRCSTVGFQIEDVAALQITQSMSTPYEPFFVVFKQKNVVTVSIRGTITFGDLLTDNDGFPVEQEYKQLRVFIHRGFLKMGEKVIQHLKSKNLIENNEIIFTGHSMGGSIATICSYLMARENKFCRSYSFSPVPALSENLCDLLSDRVTSVIFERDSVPQNYLSKQQFFRGRNGDNRLEGPFLRN